MGQRHPQISNVGDPNPSQNAGSRASVTFCPVALDADLEDALTDFLEATRVRAQRVLDAQESQATYRAGVDFMGLAIKEMSSRVRNLTNAPPGGLYLIWEALTDKWNAASEGSAERVPALRRMKCAAAEWLALPDSCEDRTGYVDRWVYEELGFKRTVEITCPLAHTAADMWKFRPPVGSSIARTYDPRQHPLGHVGGTPLRIRHFA